MLNKKGIALALTAVSAGMALSGQAQADARGFAMGGAGVAAGSYLASPMYNPALAAEYEDRDNFGMLLPTAGLGIHDGDDLYNKVEDFEDINNQIKNGGNIDELADEWHRSLKALDKGLATIDGDLGLVIAIPNRYMSINFFTKANLTLLATANVDDDDLIGDPDPDDIKSTVQGLAGGTMDIGFTFARSFGKWSVGLAPKFQRLYTLNYHESAGDFDDDEFKKISDDYVEDSTFNLDFGMTYNPGERTRIGFAAKNLFKRELETNVQRGGTDTYLVEPHYTLGVGYSRGWFSATMDADLNKRRHFAGSDYKTQFLSIGTELNAFRWAQVRAGYRHSMTDYSEDVITAGLGFSPFGRFGLDLSAQYGSDSRYGVATQLSFTF
ncbi:hypothetical protein GZ77_19355 [Endozoicomonas montiporae]|uniref:Conjugal transfer protein TraF n=2 Tax=Endozoicomonas montiporae TaxID=1027273 RepID=A0A081N2I2_9GAMM|nr:conjugal transfer protein TraF [Endozoicomonas montiporae]AMO54774.1 hypothetical protein EZMO1_0527 [Endozoicomonas montiporae CL-33]KEQ12655.1 hypothetical protein GZ77_19355 [Endozoicomonas montiporae]